MSYNGSGSFLINTAGQPVVSGTVISSTAFNALTADLATGLSTCITKDGQTTVTANIPMANYKFTGLGAGSGAADSANLSQVQSTVVKLLASVSGTDTITAVGSPTVSAYAAGQMFYFVAAGDNTGAVTINIDSLGAKAVTRDGSVALVAGDIKSGEVVVIVYDGTRFQVVSQLNSAGNATFANVSITSALNVGGVATFTGGTANGVTYLNGSKVLTSGTAITFDGTGQLGFGVGGTGNNNASLTLKGSNATNYGSNIVGTRNGNGSWFIGDTGVGLGGGATGFLSYNYDSGAPWIWYDGGASVERARINGNGNFILQGGTTTASGVGVTFPASQSASSNANCLDDYEEGTWTPEIRFGGSATGVTYSAQSGRYTKTGRIVTVSFHITLSNKGSSTGNLTIVTLPFAAYVGNAVPHYVGEFVGETAVANMPAGTYALAWSDQNLYIRLNAATAWTPVTNANLTNTSQIYASVTYEVG